MEAAQVPYLPRGVRWRWDALRQAHVLLGPERALILDEIGHAVIAEVDGMTPITGIAARLAARYGAPEEVIRDDVAEFLGGLSEARLVEVRAADPRLREPPPSGRRVTQAQDEGGDRVAEDLRATSAEVRP